MYRTVALPANTDICVGTSGASVGRRLKQFLLISIALHVIAIGILRPTRDIGFAQLPVLDVQLTAAPARQVPDEKLPAAPHARADSVAPTRQTTSREETASDLAPSVGSNISASPQHPTSLPPPTSAEVLLDSARRVARDEGRHLPPPKIDPGKFDDRPALPELARALARGKLAPGVTQFADGLLKVVTLSGSVYCLRPLPSLVRGGPVEPTIVPSTCP